MAYSEHMIKKEKSSNAGLLTFLVYFVAAVLSVLAFFTLMPFGMGSAVALIIAGLFYGAYRLLGSMKKEIEYIVTDDIIDIDIIVNRSKRSRIISFMLKEVSFIARVDDAEFGHFLTQKYDKVIDATSGRNDRKVYFTIVEKKEKTLIKMELTEKMIDGLKQISPSKIHA